MAQRKPEALSDDRLFSQWVEWIEQVKQELTGLAWNRRMYRDVTKVFRHNPHLQDHRFVWDWLRLNYVAGAAMSFRREVDRARHLGLVHLLAEIVERPTILSRRRYYECWGKPSQHADADMRDLMFQRGDLIRFPNDPMRDHIDPTSVQRDIDRLRIETELVQNYVEQTIAHRTRGEPEAITFEQFHAAIDVINPVFQKYYARLTLIGLVQLEPTAQFNTHEPFTFPWDVTCYEMWKVFTEGQRLPWDRITEVYRDDETED